MTERESFLAAICAHPDDDTVRLVYADWLEEQGWTNRAAHIRWAVASPQNSAVCLCGCVGREPNPCETCRMMGDEVAHIPRRADGETHYVLNRGFVNEIRLPSADWLAHADALYWHPDQTVACPTCDGQRIVSRHPRSDRPGGQGFSCDDCPTCSADGRISRPFVPTAHPIERVTFTALLPTPPGGRSVSVQHHYPVMYDLCRKHGVFDARGREPVELWASMDRWGFWLEVLGAEWPHVAFTPGPGVG